MTPLFRTITRRALLDTMSRSALAATIPLRPTTPGAQREPVAIATLARTTCAPPDVLTSLVRRAVEAAQAAGASYAEARLTRDVSQWVSYSQLDSVVFGGVTENEMHGIGVRALVNGAWGFAASPYWTEDEAAQLGKDATAQAGENAKWITARVELAPTTPAIGTWTTPLRVDPFSIPLEDKVDLYHSLSYTPPFLGPGFKYYPSAGCLGITCSRQERVVATSDGALFTQRLYQTGTTLTASARIDWGASAPPGVTGMHGTQREVAGTGWEALSDVDLHAIGPELADQAYAELVEAQLTPQHGVTIGRHTVVFDAATMASIVGVIFGMSTDLDRIMELEVNADGSSYLGGDPLALLGTYDYHCPSLTVSAVPSRGRKWDDEGVEPVSFPMVTKGVLQDFATSRASASILAAAYRRLGRPVRSYGCATAGDWSTPVTTGGADLVLAPSKDGPGLHDMIAAVSRGLLVVNGTVQSDWQGRNLHVRGRVREIVNGRVGAFVSNALVQIDTPEFWRNLVTLGGPRSTGAGGYGWNKGQPSQSVGVSVTAVPATFANLAVAESRRGG